jgi:hypothetical protein
MKALNSVEKTLGIAGVLLLLLIVLLAANTAQHICGKLAANIASNGADGATHETGNATDGSSNATKNATNVHTIP